MLSCMLHTVRGSYFNHSIKQCATGAPYITTTDLISRIINYRTPTGMHSFNFVYLAWALHAACKRGSYVVKLPAPPLRTNRESLPALPRRRTKSGWSIIFDLPRARDICGESTSAPLQCCSCPFAHSCEVCRSLKELPTLPARPASKAHDNSASASTPHDLTAEHEGHIISE
jgi:hypothetical protein